MRPLSFSERLTKNRFLLDEEQSHIEVNQEIAKATGTGKLIVACCPAHVTPRNPTGPSPWSTPPASSAEPVSRLPRQAR